MASNHLDRPLAKVSWELHNQSNVHNDLTKHTNQPTDDRTTLALNRLPLLSSLWSFEQTNSAGGQPNQANEAPTLLADSLTSHIINDCHEMTGSEQHLANCSSGNPNQLIAHINHEELNFSDFGEVWLIKSWQEIFFRVSFVVPIVLLGILGNLTIIYSICKFKRFRSKPTNIFILNMAIADLLTTIVCPTAALFTHIYQFYVLGAFLCRFEGFIKITCLLVSAYSLIVLSFDWLLSVVRPCRTRITTRQSWLTLVSIWLVSVLMAAPLFFWRRLRQRQWNDVVEVWCCELIQYTKYYWVGITFFLIYLPTLIMTIVLVIILAQMDQFEAKLRRTRAGQPGEPGHLSSPSSSSSTSFSSINMKYRRRIVKILFTYLLTSMICWTPLQFTIIYRHFRSEAVPAHWFFELVFFAQLFASLSSAMNPIIFGFLSQPFRQIVTKSWMFRLFDKVKMTNTTRSNKNDNNHNNPANQIPMNVNNNNLLNFKSSQQRTRSRDQDTPRLTIESIEPHNHQNNHHHRHHHRGHSSKRDSLTVTRQSTHHAQHQLGCSKRASTGHSNLAPTTSASSKQLVAHHSVAGTSNHDNNNNNNNYNHKRVSFETDTAAVMETPIDLPPREQPYGHTNAAFEATGDEEARKQTTKLDMPRDKNSNGSTTSNGYSNGVLSNKSGQSQGPPKGSANITQSTPFRSVDSK